VKAKKTKPERRASAPALNAFAGKTSAPDAQELASALGQTQALWDKLVDDLCKHEVDIQEWGSSSPKAGWSLRLKRKDRIILYLVPMKGSFQAAIVLGDKAVKVARDSKLPGRVLKTLAEARRYAEGTGIRVLVQRPEDLAAMEKLALIKLAH
jgi:hypothetical protein